MAAIAFCLTHHAAFRRHFLRVVCGINRPEAKPKITIEDKLWGDLVIHTANGIFVIEGKIKAKLLDHQNPAKGAVFWNRGYGHAILQAFDDTQRLHYIVLGYPKRLKLRPDRRLHCAQVNWEKLEKNFPSGASRDDMANELANCLSDFEVDAFYLRATREMKISAASEAAKAFEVLRGTLKELQVRDEIVGSFQNGEGEFGSEIRAAAKREHDAQLRKLERLVHPVNGDAIGWFGWESVGPKRWRRSVWFYCGDKNRRHKIRQLLRRSGNWETLYFDVPSHDAENCDRYVCVIEANSKHARLKTDQEWFVQVFRAVRYAPGRK